MRDPRIDPRPGDVLRYRDWERRVTAVGTLFGWPESVEYRRTHLRTKYSELRHTATSSGWRRFSRNADFIYVAGS